MNTNNASDEPVGFTVQGILDMAGGRNCVANALGLTIQTVDKWERRIPGKHARRVAIMAGLPLEIVRPDHVKSCACPHEGVRG